MIKIETIEGLILSVICKELSPIRYESIQKKNKLLDGTYHLQTIGEPIKYIDFKVVSKQSQVEKLNLMETKGEPLKLTEHERIFTGFVDGKIEWNRLTVGYIDRERRLYEGKINFVVKEEEENS